MNIKGNNFQIIVLFIFGIGAVLGVIFFAVHKATSDGQNLPAITMWGTLPADYFNYLGSDKSEDIYLKKVTYREIRSENFDQTLLEALADGTGPDIIILKDDSIYKNRNRLYEIPFESYPVSTFQANFIPAGRIFETDMGYYALPAIIDPLVMYWNRSILASHAIATPPTTWDVMRDFAQTVTETDGFLNITKSALSLGTFSNINHAKDIISLLLMQSGSQIVTKGGKNYVADFSQKSNQLSLPPSEALNFYTEFANPSKLAYSWNSSLPNSKAAFISEDLALYFGLASEEKEIVSANPNLAFEAALMPQVGSTSIKMTTGNVYGFAVMKNSPHLSSALTTVSKLSDPKTLKLLDEKTGLPSVARSLLKVNPTQASSTTFVNSALIEKNWIDPDNKETNKLFSGLVESVRSNQQDAKTALARLAMQITDLFR